MINSSRELIISLNEGVLRLVSATATKLVPKRLANHYLSGASRQHDSCLAAWPDGFVNAGRLWGRNIVFSVCRRFVPKGNISFGATYVAA